jgi:hypothetical protein
MNEIVNLKDDFGSHHVSTARANRNRHNKTTTYSPLVRTEFFFSKVKSLGNDTGIALAFIA